MITDSIANASIPMPAPKDFAKKKRVNRTAKLKQCKLDARREQWLSQVKKKGSKEEEPQAVRMKNKPKNPEIEDLEIKTTDEQKEEQIHPFSDSDSLSNSPNSSILGSNISGTNFTASSSGGSSTSGSFSGSISGEDEEDDWEAMADALALSDIIPKPELTNQTHELTNQTHELTNQIHESTNQTHELTNKRFELPKPKQEKVVQKARESGRAWKPDDAYRPQSLPNLAKQKSFPSGRNYSCLGGGVWAYKSAVSPPTSCPICCEDLDVTDSSFHPCCCGFRLCLFCHKRILEEDGRCPGCRKPYETEVRLARSCSMVTRF